MGISDFTKRNRILEANYLRNFVFGVEDSLVSTVGLLSGIAVTQPELKTLILAGVVLIFVEAFSMGVGAVLSQNVEQEYVHKRNISFKSAIIPGSIMFLSYFVAGIVPLGPYLIAAYPISFWLSIGASIIALFALGAISASINNLKRIPHGFEMAVIGGVAILLGVGVGSLVNTLL